MRTCDFLVIGGGVIGLSIARELKARHTDARVALIEKESSCGAHASGRNSGLLHAGFYYSPDSLKARFTKLGNERMTAYCEQNSIPSTAAANSSWPKMPAIFPPSTSW